MPALAAALPIALLLAQSPAPGEAGIHRVACKFAVNGVCQDNLPKTVGPRAGDGGRAGDATVNYNIYIGGSPVGGNGGPGGGVTGGGKPDAKPAPVKSAALPPATPASVRTSLVLPRCSLTIAGKTEVAATSCQYEKVDREFTITAQSANQKYVYTMRVALNEDKTGRASLTGGKTTATRDLGTLTRRGACWVREGDIEICAWK